MVRRQGMVGYPWRHMLALALCGALGGCSWFGSARDPNPQVYGLHDRVPEGGGVYKVGEPYVVDGQRFHPHEDPTYDRTGIASWYGEYFHGRKTANGEWYDMNRMSAAHPTLPLPVYARVTNLENGRSLVVRVNDRGPFRRNRIIDLSKGAATRLGILNQGTAPVRVTYISPAPLAGDVPNMQTVDRGGAGPSPQWTGSLPAGERVAGAGGQPARPAVAHVPEVTGSIATPRPRPKPAAGANPQAILPSGFYVEAASFASEARALSLVDELAHLGSFAVLPLEVGGDTLFHVRLGPLGSETEARHRLGALAAAGFADARVFRH